MVYKSTQRFSLLFLIVICLFGQASAGSLGEQAGQFLTTDVVTGILLTLGIVFWFMAVLTMGTGIAEFLCFCSFGLIFGGRYLIGQDLWVPLALFVAGAVFAGVEVFIIPGLGVFGVLSLVSFGGLSVLLMDSPQAGLGIFCLSVLLSIVSGYFLMKFMPKFFVTRKLFVLEPPEAGVKVNEAAGLAVSHLLQPGDVGEVTNSLRPVGMALFGTDRLEVVSEGEFLKKGARVEVVRVEGQKVVVRSCQV